MKWSKNTKANKTKPSISILNSSSFKLKKIKKSINENIN